MDWVIRKCRGLFWHHWADRVAWNLASHPGMEERILRCCLQTGSTVAFTLLLPSLIHKSISMSYIDPLMTYFTARPAGLNWLAARRGRYPLAVSLQLEGTQDLFGSLVLQGTSP